jgi:sugar phosphate permease
MRRDKVLKIAALMQIIGALTRMGSALTQTFAPIFVGALILASTAPFGFNSISMLAEVWFGDKQRATATSMMGSADIIGALATFLIQGIVSYNGFFRSGTPPEEIRHQTNLLMFYEGLLTIFIAFSLIVVMKEKPDSPPSKLAAAALENKEDLSIWKDVGQLFNNSNFVCLMLVYSIMYSVINSMMDAISPIFHSYYDKEDFISTIAII